MGPDRRAAKNSGGKNTFFFDMLNMAIGFLLLAIGFLIESHGQQLTAKSQKNVSLPIETANQCLPRNISCR
jgi:hypothetical protein